MANWYDGIPAPVDRDGRIVPLATRMLYDGTGREVDVREIALDCAGLRAGKGSVWRVRMADGPVLVLDLLHLERPDSLERLADDLGRYEESGSPCAYFDMWESETCAGCPGKGAASCAYFIVDDICAESMRSGRRSEMEASDDKRREVAASLRHLNDETVALIDERMYRLTDEELAGNAVLNIGLCKAMYEVGFDTKTLGDFWDLLADLIDRPTCHLVEDEDGYTACSECGCTALCMLDASYCPECGAMVVKTGD